MAHSPRVSTGLDIQEQVLDVVTELVTELRGGTRTVVARGDSLEADLGISSLDIQRAGRFLAGYLEDEETPAPRGDLTTARLLKLVCEDLKAYYSEAASAQPGMSASIAVEHWLFNETVLGKLLWQLRNTCTEHEDDETRFFARRSLIPDRQVQYKGAKAYGP